MVNADPAELEKFGKLAHRWWDPAGRVPPAARDQPAAPGVDRAACAARRQQRARRRLRRRHPRRGDGAARRAGHRHRPVREGAARRRSCICSKVKLAVSATRKSRSRTSPRPMPASSTSLTCMELLEHVPDPAGMVAACARLVRPGGQVFFSTINRNPKSYLFAVVGAEYVLSLLPKGTHDYQRFIKPSELSRWSRGAGLRARRADRHDLQPAHAALPSRARLRRQLPAAQRRAMPSRAVLFDFDGTLADTAPDLAAAVNRMRAEAGPRAAAARAAAPVRLRRRARPGARGVRRQARRRGIRGDARVVPRLLRRARLPRDQALPRHRRAARRARQRATSAGASSPTSRRASPKRSSARSSSSPTAWRAATPRRTSSRIPRSLLHAAAQLNLPPAACCYLGDDLRDMKAAHAAGMRAIAVDWGYHHPESGGPGTWEAEAVIAHPLDLLRRL